jgi:hypothetical protein
MTKSGVPEEAFSDLKELMDSNKTSFTMDQQMRFWGMELPVEMSEGIRKEFYEFQGAYLDPHWECLRSTMLAARYCHKERNAHRWCYAWTTERNIPANRRVNFYIADYAIKVESSKNMFTLWQGEIHFGTLLHTLD